VRALGARRARLGRPASAAALGPLVRICAASRYLAAHLAARPRLIDLLPLLAIRTRTAQEALAAAVRHAHAPDAEALARRLRRHKLVEVLRIVLRDLGGQASLPESARELSWLAASVLEAAVRFTTGACARSMDRRRDGPRRARPASACWGWASWAAPS